MGIAEILIMSIGLAADAFSVSVCRGIGMKRFRLGAAAVTALFFGAAQGAMPIFGYFLGNFGAKLISRFSPWVSFVLLGFIGAKMMVGAIRGGETTVCEYKFDLRELTLLAVATSIDAFAVGVVFAANGTDIWSSAAIISAVTFAVCVAGVALGSRFGGKYEKKAELSGGGVLILLGVKLLMDGI